MLAKNNLLEGFELVQFEACARSTGKIRINKDKNVMTISSTYMAKLGWGNPERVNLRCCGSTFALEPNKVGLITVRHNTGSNGGIITSKNFCLEVLSRTRSCREFEGWVEEGILFFKPVKGE